MRRRLLSTTIFSYCPPSTQASIRILMSLVAAKARCKLSSGSKSGAANLSHELEGSRPLTQSPESTGSHNTSHRTKSSDHLRKGFIKLAAHPQPVQQHGQLSGH